MTSKKSSIAEMTDAELLDHWKRLLSVPRTPSNIEKIVATGNEIVIRFYMKVVKHQETRIGMPLRTAADQLKESGE